MRVLLVDDHPLFLRGLREMLEDDGDLEIIGETHRGTEVMPLVARTQPDVLLLDLQLGDMDGLIVLDRVRGRFPDVRVVMISSSSNLAQIQSAFQRGACGFILKSVGTRDLAPAVRQSVEASAYHAYGLPALKRGSIAHDAGLTDRQVDVLRGVARGLSNKQIAREHWISEKTVKYHLGNIYRTLSVVNRTEAARWALANGIRPTLESDRAPIPASEARTPTSSNGTARRC